QPSDSLPALIQPAGDILVFMPTAEVPTPAAPAHTTSTPPEHAVFNDARSADAFQSFSWDLADYPTETRIEVPGTPSAPPEFLDRPSAVQPPPFSPPASYDSRGVIYSPLFPGASYAEPGNPPGAWSENGPQQAVGEQENFAAF